MFPYEWKRFDMIVMPPSFPYGGMENPCLTFVTPTLIAGDSSLDHVIIHEIAHSWMGNLITNENWSMFFLNEGFNTWLERKIIKSIYGEDIALLQSISNTKKMNSDINKFGENHEYTKLVMKAD